MQSENNFCDRGCERDSVESSFPDSRARMEKIACCIDINNEVGRKKYLSLPGSHDYFRLGVPMVQ